MKNSIRLTGLLFALGCSSQKTETQNDTASNTDESDSAELSETGTPTDTHTDTEPPAIAVGDFHEGGVVFYLDDTGFGLIASVFDAGMADWAMLYASVPGAYGEGIGEGQSNTQNAVDHFSGGSDTYAVHLCDNATDGGQSDWFLPSKEELWEMLLQQDAIDAQAAQRGGDMIEDSRFYWSSTQSDSDPRYVHGAYSELFDTSGNSVGPYAATNSKNESMYVRPVRSFQAD